MPIRATFGGTAMSRRAASIKRIIAVVILAAISEGVLWDLNASYGRFIDNGNALGVGTFLFHVQVC